MEKLLGKFLTSFISFLLVSCAALSLSKGDIWIAVKISLVYSILGLLFSEILPKVLLKRGAISKVEASYLSVLLLFAWAVTIFRVIPKLLR